MEMKKVIFLDLDGVLNVEIGQKGTFMMKGVYFEKHLIDRFNVFLESNPDIKLVMSSSWRADYQYAIKVLKEEGFEHNDKFIGKTIYSRHMNRKRHKEINMWLSDNDCDAFVVVDDRPEELIPEMENFCQINGEIGIQEKDIKNINKILNNQIGEKDKR
jgi:hydroxymethylpyrimidine pyrophosphatase-like HAD family hydrolase